MGALASPGHLNDTRRVTYGDHAGLLVVNIDVYELLRKLMSNRKKAG